ncbi:MULTISPECIES: TIGR03752 family integrating conjugative element protein [unclassified Modicisalibacter]|uniref:TIGR03752 family integrating conjugative element protein n=1 Tax=unclassified Modicisalibacter TaxID=2679913 RepID=UPI001CCC2CB0|nr:MULTISPECIES: TIGR03752 family integrating conjugative element protein [unclassified Modicisalibacter]MBZ9559063.1 TIGR03752 family integrating conjugative element protein [Modicisalibacter sp. R2A 31.J]MBZ9576826.1 TIGR03752 family integrating conjugative element protein [Modicisalibacter sp. MOD 31.J]
MKPRGNALLKFGVPIAVIAMVLIVVKGCSGGDSDGRGGTQTEEDASRTLTREEMDALGISGDSAQDTVATLVGKMNVWNQQQQEQEERIDQLIEENERLSSRKTDVDTAVQAAIREERRRQQAVRERSEKSLLSRFEQRVQRLLPDEQSGDSSSSSEDMPIGLGLEGGGTPGGGYETDQGLAWVEPMDQREDEGRRPGGRDGGPAFPTSFKAAASEVGDFASRTSSAVEAKVTGQPDAATVEPVYTIPQNSTLMGSLAMTALLGRVPVDGAVNDPYPFKVMIGKDNLTANGIELPEVQAAVASGTATGDWTLSCVRGNITSLTFVFADGTVRTVPSPDDVNEGGGNGNRRSGDRTIGGGNAIGWISDRSGIPCISGARRSNARQYLGTQGLLTAAGAGVATMLSDDDSTSVTSFGSNGTVSQAMTGNQAVGQILSQGVNDMSEWVNQLYGEAFAAVYVPPGETVAIHIDKQLPIDYETEGRKVRYDTSTATTVGLD